MTQENAKASGRFTLECRDAQGNVKWLAEESNLVVNVGLAQMAGSALAGATQATTWYIGL